MICCRSNPYRLPPICFSLIVSYLTQRRPHPYSLRTYLSPTTVTRMVQYSYTQPSSSSHRSVSSTARRRAVRSKGFPDLCYCGLVGFENIHYTR
ncbi:unnamed protein product [Arabis nemorensis]|uniref:Uncharacterized protein n=1 Tax=Arabis nemorensis TaxID=586526 RepID=A0A565BBZ6_9BRAS|nr:unnamed protein product [Arabis nemorensis]